MDAALNRSLGKPMTHDHAWNNTVKVGRAFGWLLNYTRRPKRTSFGVRPPPAGIAFSITHRTRLNTIHKTLHTTRRSLLRTSEVAGRTREQTTELKSLQQKQIPFSSFFVSRSIWLLLSALMRRHATQKRREVLVWTNRAWCCCHVLSPRKFQI